MWSSPFRVHYCLFYSPVCKSLSGNVNASKAKSFLHCYSLDSLLFPFYPLLRVLVGPPLLNLLGPLDAISFSGSYTSIGLSLMFFFSLSFHVPFHTSSLHSPKPVLTYFLTCAFTLSVSPRFLIFAYFKISLPSLQQ